MLDLGHCDHTNDDSCYDVHKAKAMIVFISAIQMNSVVTMHVVMATVLYAHLYLHVYDKVDYVDCRYNH